MANLKHVGRVKSTGRKCLVVFRTLPNDAFNCLVIQTELLSDSYHNALMTLVETNAAQTAFEFSEVLARSTFPDGNTMLPALHLKGMLTKFPTDQIEMLPNNNAVIPLAELNQLIAQQRGVSVQDLAIAGALRSEVKDIASVNDISPTNNNTDPLIDQDLGKTTSTSVNQEPLTNEQLASKYRSDADRLSKEAASLRRLAEELVPTKKKVKA